MNNNQQTPRATLSRTQATKATRQEILVNQGRRSNFMGQPCECKHLSPEDAFEWISGWTQRESERSNFQ